MGIDGMSDQQIERALSHLGIRDDAVSASAGGQNNDVVTVRVAPDGAEVVFRFPRHPRAVEELAREVALLRALHGRLPLPIPDPIYLRLDPPEPGEAFMGYPKLPGELLNRADLEALPRADDKRRVADQLGAFLTALHAVPTGGFDPPLAVANDRATWVRMYADVRAGLFPLMRADARRQVAAHFEACLDDPASSAWTPTVIHGDFGPGNILYDADTRAVGGILDWDSAGLGDPATDLAALIGAHGYGADFAKWLAPDYPSLAAELPRARFYLGTFALQEALFGLTTGDAKAFESGMADYR
jgi:aminoglycoside 2''-phosphotransferase